MLSLSRKIGEWVQVGPDIRIVVLDISSGKVRLGFEAPKDVRIIRTELLPLEPSPEERHAT